MMNTLASWGPGHGRVLYIFSRGWYDRGRAGQVDIIETFEDILPTLNVEIVA